MNIRTGPSEIGLSLSKVLVRGDVRTYGGIRINAKMRANPDRWAGRPRSEPHFVSDRLVPLLPPCPTEAGNVAAMLIAVNFEDIRPPRCRISCTSLPMRTFPPWNSASRRPRLPISWSALDVCASSSLTDHSMSGHLPSHLSFSAVIISSCLSVAGVPSSRRGPELEPRWLRL